MAPADPLRRVPRATPPLALAAAVVLVVPAAFAFVSGPILLTATSPSPTAFFGQALAVAGDAMVVGAPGEDAGGVLDAGAAYVFARAGGGWTPQAKLAATDATEGDDLGYAVAVDGTTVVLGAPSDRSFLFPGPGSAYVFTRSGGTWTQQAKLLASDGAPGDQFGGAVAVSGDTVLVGAWAAGQFAGKAYVFTRTGSTWTQQATLTASVADEFGFSVALEGDTAVVGAPKRDFLGGTNAGSALVFTRTSGAWTLQAELAAADFSAGDHLGYSVALDGDTVLLGAKFDDTAPVGNDGSAYAFVRTGGAWSQQAKLAASDAAFDDWFGHAVALTGDIALIGAYGVDLEGQSKAGAAYLFTRVAGLWRQQVKLMAGADASGNDQFGYAVAAGSGTLAVGAHGDDFPAGTDAGSAYAFRHCGPDVPDGPFVRAAVCDALETAQG